MVKPRASARYWIEVATVALTRYGPEALTIDALCRRTGKTKGSFYAHFESHDAFLAALAAAWRESSTDAIKRAADEGSSPGDRLALLNQHAVNVDSGIDQGMRRLGEKSPTVETMVAEVDKVRIAYLADLYQATEWFSEAAAKDLATIEYAAFVGLQMIKPQRGVDELRRLHTAFAEFLRAPALMEQSALRPKA